MPGLKGTLKSIVNLQNDVSDQAGPVKAQSIRNIVESFGRRSVNPVTSTYSATDTDYYIQADATAAAFTITLPEASTMTGQELVFKRINSGANLVTIAASASQSIDGASTYTGLSSQYAKVTLLSTGSGWAIIA